MFATAFWASLVEQVVPIRHPLHQSDHYIRTILPDSSPNLVWIWQPGLATQNASQWVSLPSLSLSGLLTHKMDYYSSVQAKGLVVKLRPWALGLLKGGSAIESVNQTINLPGLPASIDPGWLKSGPLAFQSFTSWLEPIFERHFSLNAYDPSVSKAVQTIQQSQPGSRIKALAEQAAQCTRQFERRFKAATGLTPKQFMRNVRFERARNQLVLGQSLLDVTYACGYFDQTHFTREFKTISGITPKTFQQNTVSLFY